MLLVESEGLKHKKETGCHGSYMVRKMTKKCIDPLEDSLPGTYIGSALIFEKEICGRDRKEVSELHPERTAPERIWTGRAAVLPEADIVIN